jgi:hypothetical protein
MHLISSILFGPTVTAAYVFILTGMIHESTGISISLAAGVFGAVALLAFYVGREVNNLTRMIKDVPEIRNDIKEIRKRLEKVERQI